jgi:hypothetical protein
MDIFHTFYVVEREMISNNNNLSFCNIGGRTIFKKDQQIVLRNVNYNWIWENAYGNYEFLSFKSVFLKLYWYEYFRLMIKTEQNIKWGIHKIQ